MFDAAHAMRTRIVTSEAFDGEKVFGRDTASPTPRSIGWSRKTHRPYLWEDKGIVPFLKIDVGLQPEANGVQLMRDIDDLGVTLSRCGRRDPKLDDDDAPRRRRPLDRTLWRAKRVLRLGRWGTPVCVSSGPRRGA